MDFLRRLWRHLVTGHLRVRRDFPAVVLERIEAAIKDCESRHAGEIRFAVEPALAPAQVCRGLAARQRALEVFSHLRVWDTEHNNGVLVYLLLADRAVEIVADRGAAGDRVAPAEWQAVCRAMEQHFRDGEFEQGAVAGIRGVAAVLARHPPGRRGTGNELPDKPVIL
ncbi:MAG: TPM domain-containing protein [Nevskia sp.]|nr:TPM domain-containing protein [Nevskia sp.]